jgi:hypothetical protein
MKVKVRIAVAVDDMGIWSSCGSSAMSDEESMSNCLEGVSEGENRYFVTATLDRPEKAEDVPGDVEPIDAAKET